MKKVIKIKRFNRKDYYYQKDLDSFLSSLEKRDLIDVKHETENITYANEYTTIIYLDKLSTITEEK